MDSNTPFSDLGIDAVSGTEIMNALEMPVYDLQDTFKFNRLQEVMGYLKTVPEEARLGIIRKITVGKPVDNKLDHVWGYVKLRVQAEQQSTALDNTKKELSYYEE